MGFHWIFNRQDLKVAAFCFSFLAALMIVGAIAGEAVRIEIRMQQEITMDKLKKSCTPSGVVVGQDGSAGMYFQCSDYSSFLPGWLSD